MAKTGGLGGALFRGSVPGVAVSGVVFCRDEVFVVDPLRSGRCGRESLYCGLLDCRRRRHVSLFGFHAEATDEVGRYRHFPRLSRYRGSGDTAYRFGLFRGILQFVTWCFVLAAFLAPLSVAYAIARHRVIDVRFVLSRGFVYLILSLMLAAAMASTYWITNIFLQQAHVAALVQLPFAILVGVILMRVYRLDGFWNRSLVFPAALRGIATDFVPVRRVKPRRIVARIRKTHCIRAGNRLRPCRRRDISANA